MGQNCVKYHYTRFGRINSPISNQVDSVDSMSDDALTPHISSSSLVQYWLGNICSSYLCDDDFQQLALDCQHMITEYKFN